MNMSQVLRNSRYPFIVLIFWPLLQTGIKTRKRAPLKDLKFLFQKKTSYNGVLFLQETHSSSKDEIKWKDDLKGGLFFWHEKTNSYGVVIGYTGKRSFRLLKIKMMKTVVF